MAVKVMRLDVQIMKALKKCKSFSITSGLTIDELMVILEELSVEKSRSTFYRRLEFMIKNSFIERGCVDNHAKTYYISEKGIKFIETGVM